MEKCSFEKGKCSVDCKKYAMCSYMAIQKQLSEFQEQFSFIYSVLKDIIDKNENTINRLNELNNRLFIFTEDLLTLYNDSDTKKESINNEEKN